MGTRVSYEHSEGISTISMDDGKVNAMSVAMMEEINAALDQAQENGSVVVLTGREGVFSAGFDLAVFKQGMEPLMEMLRAGAKLAERMLSFPSPIVAACSGHAIAMGSFLLMASDVRIGTQGPFKIGLNEVAIGMTLPYFGVELARARLAVTHLERSVGLAQVYEAAGAVEAGYLDEAVEESELLPRATALAEQLANLDMEAHRNTKERIREGVNSALDKALSKELGVD